MLIHILRTCLSYEAIKGSCVVSIVKVLYFIVEEVTVYEAKSLEVLRNG